ncbi:MAG: hypothetical protein HQL81_06820 [Magnetococcales bacterium]|nr:hypothetical protein [Magnetococcales bacterium]
MPIERSFSPRVIGFLNRIDLEFLESLADMFERGELTENGFTPDQEEEILRIAESARKKPPVRGEDFLQEIRNMIDADQE